MIFFSIHKMANFVISLFLGNESCTANNIIAIQGRVAEEPNHKSKSMNPTIVLNCLMITFEAKSVPGQLISLKNCLVTI